MLRAIALEVVGLDVVAQGQVGPFHADVADLELRIAIEAESFEFHALPEAFRHDIRRYTQMTRLGWLVVRFVWEDVMHRPAYVHAVLADLVALRQMEAVGRQFGLTLSGRWRPTSRTASRQVSPCAPGPRSWRGRGR